MALVQGLRAWLSEADENQKQIALSQKMAFTEKGRRKGDPIPNCVLADRSELKSSSSATQANPSPASPLAVSDPHIRKMLQLSGLRFVCSRARWLDHEATNIGVALKSGAITSDEADNRIDELGALDLVYPELMGGGE
jgi:hypothetical protein